MTALELAEQARHALLEKKGEQVVILDVRKVSTVTDFYVIGTGRTPPQLKAMLSEVQAELKQSGLLSYRRAGDPEGGWLVLDYVDVVIHMFSREAREYYAVEALWAEAPRL